MTYQQIVDFIRELRLRALRHGAGEAWAEYAAADAFYSTARRLGLEAYQYTPDQFRALAFKSAKYQAKTIGRTEARRAKTRKYREHDLVSETTRCQTDRMACTIDAKAALTLVSAKTNPKEKQTIRRTLGEDQRCTPSEHTQMFRTRSRLSHDAELSRYDIGKPAA